MNTVYQNIVSGLQYHQRYLREDLPKNGMEKSRYSIMRLYDLPSVTSEAGWTIEDWNGYPGFYFWNKGGEVEIHMQRTNLPLGDIYFNDTDKMIYMKEYNSGRKVFHIKYGNRYKSWYFKAKDFIRY